MIYTRGPPEEPTEGYTEAGWGMAGAGSGGRARNHLSAALGGAAVADRAVMGLDAVGAMVHGVQAVRVCDGARSKGDDDASRTQRREGCEGWLVVPSPMVAKTSSSRSTSCTLRSLIRLSTWRRMVSGE